MREFARSRTAWSGSTSLRQVHRSDTITGSTCLQHHHYHCHHNCHHKFFANLLVVRVQPGRLKRLVLSQPITSRWGDSYSYVQISALLSAASNIFDGGLSLKSSWGRWENCIWGKLLESLQSWDLFLCKKLQRKKNFCIEI